MKLPANIKPELTIQIWELVAELHPAWQDLLSKHKVQAYGVSQSRGRAYRRKDEFGNLVYYFTIPEWALKDKRPGFALHYVCHEISHIVDYTRRGTSDHSRIFHNIFKAICPREFQHYEVEYMKRAAGRGVGVSSFTSDDLEDCI